MSYETDLILRHRCRLARAVVRAACGWCEHCERTERGSQQPLARAIGVDPGALCQFIAGRDISGKFLVAVEAWAAESRAKTAEWRGEGIVIHSQGAGEACRDGPRQNERQTSRNDTET